MTPEQRARAANTRANLRSVAGCKEQIRLGKLPPLPETKKP